MSKNFELMQQAEARANVPATQQLKRSSPGSSEYNNGRIVRLNLDDVAREESANLVQNIFLLGNKEAPRVVIFAGINSGNGCSSICAYSARLLASHNLGTVCLVDANLRSPTLPEFFGVSNHYGLTDALRNDDSVRTFTKQVGPENLWLLSCGSLASEGPRLLNSEMMRARVVELRKQFDYVLIDIPALNTYSDGIAVGQLADGLVLVLEANATRREAAVRIAENLRAAQIKILGAVLNKRTFPIPALLYNLL
jgi:Mrp family chromosome partitioning ATPase